MKKIIYLISIAMLTSINAFAEVRINGFANLVGGFTTDEDEALFDYNDRFTFDQESLFALQVTGDVNSKTKATAQIVSRGSDDYSPFFEWAYFTYNISQQSNLSAGRFRIPLFKYSSSLDVGYSYHWIQPPQSIYGVDFNTIEGVRYDYTDYAGDWEYQLQVFAGAYDQEIISPSTGVDIQSDIYDVFGSSIQVTREWLNMRLLLARGENDAIIPPLVGLIDGLTAAGYANVADLIAINRDEGIFIEFGIDVDFYDWFVGIEYVDTYIINSFVADSESIYITAGMRFGPFTPHITFERDEGTPQTYAAEVAGIADPGLQALTAGTLASFGFENEKMTIGLRYDFQPNMAFKFDVTKQDDKLNPSATGENATLVRAAVSFVF